MRAVLVTKQRMGSGGCAVFVLLLHVITSFAIDIYVPAVPGMSEYFDASEQLITASLTGFMLFNAMGLLVFGTLSDKYGRKAFLVGGTAAYAVAGLACALSVNAEMFVACRCLQAASAACASSVAIAVVKDCFVPQVQERMYVGVQMAHIVGPVVSPLIGAALLENCSWQSNFWFLFGLGAVCFAMSLLYEESLPKGKRQTGNTALGQLGRIGHVLKHRGFTLFLAVMSLFIAPFTIYVTTSPYVVMETFGYTAQEYGAFFAGTALCAALGPLTYGLLLGRFSKKRLAHLLQVIGLASILIQFARGMTSSLGYFVAFVLYYYALVIMKPFATNILMNQAEADAGTAASLTMFAPQMAGCVITQVATSVTSDFLVAYAVPLAACLVASCALWLYVCARKVKVKGLIG